MKTFTAQIYACDRVFFEGELESLIIPYEDGLHGIWADHINLIGALIPGVLTYRLPEKENEIAIISEGMIKIEDNNVLILVSSIERPEEIDANRAQRAIDKAREEMLQKRSIQEFKLAEMSLARAINRLKAKGKQVY